MTIYPDRPITFTCAICNREVEAWGRNYWQWSIPPLCRTCEHGGHYATGYSYRNRYAVESNRDRRILSQLRALCHARA